MHAPDKARLVVGLTPANRTMRLLTSGVRAPANRSQALAFIHRFHATEASPVNPHDVEMNEAATPAL
jgi:hypothetical protein